MDEDLTSREENLEISTKVSSRMVSGPEFQPNFILSEWEEYGSTIGRINVAIWLPLGVLPNNYTLNVSPCGTILEVHVVWPNVFSDPMLLHKHWLQ